MERLCFGEPSFNTPSDVLFIFGTTHGVKELVKVAASYIRTHAIEASNY